MADVIKRDTVDYRDPTPFDNTKLNSLSDISKALRHKTYGEDTREAIAQQGEALAKLMQETGGNQSAEVVAARGNFELLGIREDAQDNRTAQLSRDVSYKVDGKYVQDVVSKIIPGTPQGTYSTLGDLQTAYPNGASGVYITTVNGHWYYYNGGWKDGGVYQSAGIGKGVLNPENFNLPMRYGSAVSGLITIDLQALKLTVSKEVAIDTGRGYIYPNIELNQDIPASDGRPYTVYYVESTNEFKILLTEDAKHTTGDYIIIARVVGNQLVHNSIPRCLILKNAVIDNPLVGTPSIIQGKLLVDFINKKITIDHIITSLNGNYYQFNNATEIAFDKTTPAQYLVFDVIKNSIKLTTASPLYPDNSMVLMVIYNNHVYSYSSNANVQIIGEPVTGDRLSFSDISSKMYAGKALVLTAYGDSTDAQTTGWPTQLEPILQRETGNTEITVHKGGFGGKPLTWLNDNFYENFGSDAQFADTNIIILGGILNNGSAASMMDNYRVLLKSIIDKAKTLNMKVIMRTSQASAITRFTTDKVPNYERNQWEHYAFENKMRREYATSNNMPLLDFESATDLFQKYSRVPHSELFEDRFHFDTRGSQFEAEWVASQLLGRVITVDDEYIINNTTQNIKSEVDWSYIQDVTPIDANGFKTTIKMTDNAADTLIYDSIIMNLNKKPMKLVACCDVPSTVHVNVNGTDYKVDGKETVILPHAEIGLYTLKAYTGRDEIIDFKGFKFVEIKEV